MLSNLTESFGANMHGDSYWTSAVWTDFGYVASVSYFVILANLVAKSVFEKMFSSKKSV